MTKPILLDALVAQHVTAPCTAKFPNGKWYLARPANEDFRPLRRRLYHAWLVLTAQAFAVQYAENHFKEKS